MIIGYIKNHSTLIEFKIQNNEVLKVSSDLSQIRDKAYSLILLNSKDESIEAISKIIENESKHCPVVTDSSVNLDLEALESLSSSEMATFTQKIFKSWVLKNNLNLIENNFNTVKHLSNLWLNDRNAFFEELWFTLKTNIGASNVEIIFHDLKEPTEAQKEKGAKNQLMYAYVKGTKNQQIFEAKDAQTNLMQEYKNEFTGAFQITEFSKDKEELIITSKLKLSPILVLIKTAEFNSIQKSLFSGVFNALAQEV